MNDKVQELEIEEALTALLDCISPIMETEMIKLDDANGAVCAGDIRAGAPVPAFPRSAMDGYAVRAKDVCTASEKTPVHLSVIGELMAGDDRKITCVPNTAVRVMTGAMIPEGYDTVVRQEDTDYGDDEVTIYKALQKHTNFCPVGEELEKGDLVIPAGRKIGRIETALLAEIGMHKVSVVRPAKIAILSTGSELAKVGDALKPGQIYNSILHMLGASIRQEGLRVVYAKSCGDEKEQICRELDHALEEADLVLTTGGVSVGKRDLLPYVLDEMGAKRLFHYAKIQPGTPTMGSVIDGKVILSLSGNPYAALANFDYYFWPAAAKLMNSDAFLTQTRTACLAEPYDKINRMRRLIRAFYKDGNVYLPEKKHQSSVAGNLTSCNCYIDLPAGERIVVGDSVTVRLMKN